MKLGYNAGFFIQYYPINSNYPKENIQYAQNKKENFKQYAVAFFVRIV